MGHAGFLQLARLLFLFVLLFSVGFFLFGFILFRICFRDFRFRLRFVFRFFLGLGWLTFFGRRRLGFCFLGWFWLFNRAAINPSIDPHLSDFGLRIEITLPI